MPNNNGETPLRTAARHGRVRCFTLLVAATEDAAAVSEIVSFKSNAGRAAAAALLWSSCIPFSGAARRSLRDEFVWYCPGAIQAVLSVDDIAEPPVESLRLVGLLGSSVKSRVELDTAQARNLLALVVQAARENPDKIESIAATVGRFSFDRDDPAVNGLVNEWNKLICAERVDTVESVLDMGL